MKGKLIFKSELNRETYKESETEIVEEKGLRKAGLGRQRERDRMSESGDEAARGRKRR
jgi:hypothetical protein